MTTKQTQAVDKESLNAGGHTPGQFRLGQLAIVITQPALAAARNRYVARVTVGCNHLSAEGKTPERAARWLCVHTAGLYAYADACRSMCFTDAAKVRRAAMRAAVAQTTGAAA